MYEYDDDEEGGRSTGRTVAAVAGVVVLALVGWFVIKPKLGSDDAGTTSVAPASANSTSVTEPDDSVGTGSGSADTVLTTEPLGTTVERGRIAGATTTAAPATTAAAAVTTVASTAPPTTPAPVAPPVEVPTYETLPDGTPVPILALYGTDKITLTGAVPDEASKQRLQDLALANAKPGQGTIENFLTINPTVPLNIGVRVVELTSTRFPEGSAEVLLPHAAELNRIAAIMNALPNLTALVIGHADQRGEEATNYAISAERADAVVDYLVTQGVAPSRLSSRAVGEADLLTLNNEPAALELNRRTEFVLYGLLLG